MARPGLRKHPKFLLLRELLGVCEAHTLGHLELLWETAYESGKAEVGTSRQVELSSGWGGKAGVFCQSALDCGGDGEPGFIELIEDKPGRYQVHDLYDHAPEYVKKRMEREQERIRKGKTISDLRAEAGRISGNKRKQVKITCSENRTNGEQTGTNGDTPSPSPSPLYIEGVPSLSKEETSFNIADLVGLWNALPEVRKATVVNAKRRTAFKARWKEATFREGYQAALAKFPLKCFSDDGGWRPDIDWFLRAGKVTEIIEGKFDWVKTSGGAQGQQNLGLRLE